MIGQEEFRQASMPKNSRKQQHRRTQATSINGEEEFRQAKKAS
jgi:hypothetical protein